MHAATNKWAWRGAAKEGGIVTEDVAWNTMLRNQLMKVREETGNLSYVEGYALWDRREACAVSQPKEEGHEKELTSSVSAKALNSKGNLRMLVRSGTEIGGASPLSAVGVVKEAFMGENSIVSLRVLRSLGTRGSRISLTACPFALWARVQASASLYHRYISLAVRGLKGRCKSGQAQLLKGWV